MRWIGMLTLTLLLGAAGSLWGQDLNGPGRTIPGRGPAIGRGQLPPPAARDRDRDAEDRFQESAPSFGSATLSDAAASVDPDIWIYMREMQRYDDPAQAVRRKAERKAEQRRERMAALKWYGFSASRPQASPTPYTSSYSPRWISNSHSPFGWVPTYYHSRTVVVPAEDSRR